VTGPSALCDRNSSGLACRNLSLSTLLSFFGVFLRESASLSPEHPLGRYHAVPSLFPLFFNPALVAAHATQMCQGVPTVYEEAAWREKPSLVMVCSSVSLLIPMIRHRSRLAQSEHPSQVRRPTRRQLPQWVDPHTLRLAAPTTSSHILSPQLAIQLCERTSIG
jgi:hypothetical protein